MDYALITINDECGLLFIGRILDLPGPLVKLCTPDGRPMFLAPRERVRRVTREEFEKLLREEAEYQRNQRAEKLRTN